MKLKSKILVIAGSDSSGGAGIQADIKTATSLGVYSMTAVTAVTVQNTKGVKSVITVPPDEIYNQIIHTIKDIRPNAIKIGMLHSKRVIDKVVRSLNEIKVKKIVLDPVMVAKGGSKLITDSAVQLMKKKLLNKVSLIDQSFNFLFIFLSYFSSLDFSKPILTALLKINIRPKKIKIKSKKYRRYDTADNIRDELSKMNVTIKDIDGKTEWEIL